MRRRVWVFSLAILAIVEVVYLIRHPRTFSGLAAVVGLFLSGLSYLFLYRGENLNLVYFTQVVAALGYYGIKLYR